MKEFIFMTKIPTVLKEKLQSKTNQRICIALALFFSIVLVASLCMGLRSCSESSYDFHEPEDAIKEYRKYLTDIRTIKMKDGKQFCDEINKWQEISDTVFVFISADSVPVRKNSMVSQFYDIKDSIRYEFVRLTETWKCSFSDVILVKEGTTPFRDDKEIVDAVHDATPFFLHLDSIAPRKVSKQIAIDDYRYFLKMVKAKGVHSKGDMLAFITEEDRVFRAFLDHLYELDDDKVSDITHTTEQICSDIFKESKMGNIDAKDALTYMSMRTVRRLLQNSRVCVNDINFRRMKTKMQANAYLWMIIQPFTSIDKFAIVTLTPEERESFRYIAEKLPKSTSFAKAFNIDQNALSYLLPQQMLKMYVLTL